MVPLQATWQAELAYEDLLDPRLDLALERGERALGKVDRMLVWLGAEGLDAFADRQRLAITQTLAAERLEVERMLDKQRGGVQAFAGGEWRAAVGQLREERIAATADVQRLADHTAAEAARRAKEVVDYALVRVALLLGAALAVTLGFALALRRRAAPR